MTNPSEKNVPEAIAIVGMGMRFPGASHSSEAFWDMLRNGRTGWMPMPKHRYDASGYYHPDSARAGSIWVQGSHFLSGEYEKHAQVFDAPFFSMSTTEVNGSDPQQLHMLEVSFEALENAGIPMQKLAGSNTSVYVGCFTRDFEAKGGRDPYTGPFYAATGNGQSMLSNRLSWFYDLRGPSMTVDTACSSSLYAVHLACQSLRTGESKMAIVGGTNLICDPSYMRDLTTMGFLSPDGKCHSFDHRANGYARGDGIGAVVLKTVSQAIKDGDTIRAIIRNTGLGQDGRTPGITMPSPDAQANLIRHVYQSAGLSMDQTAYFEAHGTGTPIGDPYELSSLGETFGKTRDPANPLYVGSVKTNIGHLEGCAGLAGLIKSVLVVEHGMIPPLADFEAPNPRLKLEEWKVALPIKLTPWPVAGPRRVSINCFGYGGANSHAIVDDAFSFLSERGLQGQHQTAGLFQFDQGSDTSSLCDSGFSSFNSTPAEELKELKELSIPRPKIFPISCVDQAGLQRTAAALNQLLEAQSAEGAEDMSFISDASQSDSFISRLAYTLVSRRSLFDHRSFVVARSPSELRARLSETLPKARRAAKSNNIFFVFTGQGAQWSGMGNELLKHDIYRRSLERAQVQLDALGCEWSLISMLSGDSTRIDDPRFSQPLCTALQLALVDLLSAWSIIPKAVVGHSSGEIAAAYAAGYLTHEHAIKVAYCRGLYSADVNNRLGGNKKGTMLAVGLSDKDVQPYLEKVRSALAAGQPEGSQTGTADVACVNSPQSVTLSGDCEAIDMLETLIQEDDIFARKLRVKTAYHSHHMKVIADDYLQSMSDVQPQLQPPGSSVTMFSSVTGKVISADDLSPDYWVKNMLGKVRFSDAVKALLTQPANPDAKGARRKAAVVYSAMVEVGPTGALKGPLQQIISAVDNRLSPLLAYTSLLSRSTDSEVSILTAVGKLWAHGITLDLHPVNFQTRPSKPHHSLACLPPYQWNHNKIYQHWSAWGLKNLKRSKPRTDLLGMRLETADAHEHRWHNYVRILEQPWIADHRVQQMVVYPGAAMVVQAIEAARELLDESRTCHGIEARKINFKRGTLIPTGEGFVETAIHLKLQPAATTEEECYAFSIFSQTNDEPWFEICTGFVAVLYQGDEFSSQELQKSWQNDVEIYDRIQRHACCTIQPRTFYKMFDEKMNLQYGPLHRNVTKCIAGSGEGYGVITIPDTQAAMPAHFEYPHLIHPATLDSVFHLQALGYLYSLTGDESLVPISVESIFVSGKAPTAPGTELLGYSKGIQSDSGDTIGDIVLSDKSFQSAQVVVRGFLSRDISAKAAAGNGTVDEQRTRKCTRMEYIPLHQKVVDGNASDADETGTDGAPVNSAAATESAGNASLLDTLVVLHPQNLSADMSNAIEELQSQLFCLYQHITLVSSDNAAFFAEQSNLQGKTVLSLLEAEDSLISNWTEEQFKMLRNVFSAADIVVWVTRGAEPISEQSLAFSSTTGLLRTIRVERPQLRLLQLDIAATTGLRSPRFADLVTGVFQASVLTDAKLLEQEFVELNGELHVPRLRTDESFHAELDSRQSQSAPVEQELSSLVEPAKAIIGATRGTVCFENDELCIAELGEEEVELTPSLITLDATALQAGTSLGRDAVGVVTGVGAKVSDFAVGDQVVVCSISTMRTHLRVHSKLVQKQPPFLSSNVTVSMPSAITSAYISLVDLAQLRAGQSVLISTPPDAFGLALIQLTLAMQGRVFVSFESAYHRRLLLDHIGLDENQIIKVSHDVNFAKRLRERNGGLGVDAVVISQPGNIAHQSIACLADFGRCVSVGSEQLLRSASTPLACGITIANLDFEHMRRTAPERTTHAFHEAWTLAQNGVFHSMLPKRTLDLANLRDVTASFESLNAPGGATIRMRPSSAVLVMPKPPLTLQLDPAATYVLSGGLGGIGRSIAETLFQAGARKLAFISRSGAKTDEAKKLIASLQGRGCTAKAYACDVASSSAVEKFATGALERGETIKGVIQCAMVLRDSIFDNMTFQQWQESTRPKVQGSWNLHKCLPKDMDFFIMLSSMAGVIGNPGQANYSSAGTYQDSLSVYRRNMGQKSMTIDLGIVSDVGYIAENPEQFERLGYLKPLFISERSLTALLSAAMLGQTRDGEHAPAQLITGVGRELMQDGSIGSAMNADLKYSNLHNSNSRDEGDASEDEIIQHELKHATSLSAACDVIDRMFAAQVAKACSMDVGDVDLEKPMHSYGVDSLAAVEVRNTIFRKVQADVSVFDILSTLPLRKLGLKVIAKSKLTRMDVKLAAQEESAE